MSDLAPSELHPPPAAPLAFALHARHDLVSGERLHDPRNPIAISAGDADGARFRDAPEQSASALRAGAHAAWRAVQGGGAPALDAALDVLDAEVAALRACVGRQQEALKILGLYASDPWSRSLAQRALGCSGTSLASALPATLYDRDLAESACSGEGSRFPDVLLARPWAR